jgi:glycosyltransferase involved in cell wall biosynthesis
MKMKISGFSFVRNGVKLYYPVRESIESILPICDEFIVAVGEGDEDDNTREVIESIGSPKIKIIDTKWDEKHWKKGAINSIQTNVALKECSGDWCFYVQADEVVHEKYLPTIKSRCEELLDNHEVEGLLFKYKHFWGDYDHYHKSHAWYPEEIRIVRNHPKIHSWESAQSFRFYEEYRDTHQREDTRKLKVARVDAEIFHYGWVRPPHMMRTKQKALNSVHWGRKRAEEDYDKGEKIYDYGPLDRLEVYKDSHPKVMDEMISRMDWKDKLQYSGKPSPSRELHKHERTKYKVLSAIENNLLGGNSLGGFKNYELVKGV